MSEDILLTITMLVSDREDTIEKCLGSLAHLRETVPSELIVVDTAGNKTCMDIVKRYTEKIVPFKWINDFAAARNAGLKKAKGKWVMFLDDDEWFESTEGLENFFLSGEYKEYNSAAYLQRNYHDMAGTDWQDHRAVRIAKREKGTCFQGKIHESLYPLKAPVRYLPDYVHHYGYVFKSDKDKFEHVWRNVRPLLEMRKKDPSDLHAAIQLIQEYVGAGEYFSLLEVAREVRNTKKCWSKEKLVYTTYAVTMEMSVYKRQNRYEDGYRIGRSILQQKDLPVLARGNLYNFMADFSLRRSQYDETLEYIDEFLKALAEWKDCPNKEEQICLAESEKYLTEKEAARLSIVKLHIHTMRHHWEEAEETLFGIDWSRLGEYSVLMDLPFDIVRILKQKGYRESCFPVLEAVYKNQILRKYLYRGINDLKAGEREVLLEYLSHLPPEDFQTGMYHIYYAGCCGDREIAVRALEKMRDKNYPLFLSNEEYWDCIQKLDIPVNDYMTVGFHDWMNLADKLFLKLQPDVCGKAYLCLARGLEKTDIRFIHLSALLMQNRLLHENEAPLEELWGKLYQLSQYWISCGAVLYREEVFTGGLLKAIPPAYQFGWHIMQANALKGSRPEQFVRKVAEAAKAYPVMKELCKRVIREINTGCRVVQGMEQE